MIGLGCRARPGEEGGIGEIESNLLSSLLYVVSLARCCHPIRILDSHLRLSPIIVCLV